MHSGKNVLCSSFCEVKEPFKSNTVELSFIILKLSSQDMKFGSYSKARSSYLVNDSNDLILYLCFEASFLIKV